MHLDANPKDAELSLSDRMSDLQSSVRRLIADTIDALARVDEMRLEALANEAEALPSGPFSATAAELASLQRSIQILRSVLAETSRNVQVVTGCAEKGKQFEYRPGHRKWAD